MLSDLSLNPASLTCNLASPSVHLSVQSNLAIMYQTASGQQRACICLGWISDHVGCRKEDVDVGPSAASFLFCWNLSFEYNWSELMKVLFTSMCYQKLGQHKRGGKKNTLLVII